jgi:hypothetical protein
MSSRVCICFFVSYPQVLSCPQWSQHYFLHSGTDLASACTPLRAVAETMVQMEVDYVTPSFFRELEKQYQAEQGQGEDRLDQLATGGCCRGLAGATGQAALQAEQCWQLLAWDC